MSESIPAREVFVVNECGNYKRKLRIVIEREVTFVVPPWRTVDEQDAVQEAVKVAAIGGISRKLAPMGWKVVGNVDICRTDDI